MATTSAFPAPPRHNTNVDNTETQQQIDQDARWAFLDPWFARLRGTLAVDNPRRADADDALVFGRDPASDWWLRFDDAPLDITTGTVTAADSAAEDEDAAVATVLAYREALLLAGALARVDNAAWVRKLRTLSAFAPAPFMDLGSHALPAHFLVAFTELTSRKYRVLSSWLRRDAFNDEFTRDYKRLLACVEEEAGEEHDALSLRKMLPRLRFRFMVHSERFLTFIASMLAEHLQEVETNPDAPGFCVDAIELTVLCMWGAPSVPDVLRRIVTLGVPIEHLDLSIVFYGHDATRMTTEWRESFIKFVRALCGHGEHEHSTGTGFVKKLTIPEGEVVHPDFEVLCSGLQHARGLRHFAIGADVKVRESDPVDPFPPGIWSLIALVLMSKDSTTSVEACSVRGIPFTLEDTEEVLDMIGLVYPMHAYISEWVLSTHPPQPGNRVPRKVSLPVGTAVSAYYGFEGEEYTIELEHTTEAYVICEDAGIAHVLIPGRGFCRAASRAVPSKRVRYTRRRQDAEAITSSLLKSLELVTHPLDTTSQAQVKEFLQFVGGKTLQRLRLNIPRLGEQEIRDVFESCPNLEYLVLDDVAMPSMAAFKEARAAGVRLRSLALARLSVPDQPMVDYLRGALARKERDEDDDDTVLTGLRLGQVSDVVLQHLESSLEDSSIEYLDYTVTAPVQSTFVRLAEQHNHKPTGDILIPLPPASTMAFLGGIRAQAASIPAFSLTDEMKALIVTFAATPQTRVVLCRQLETRALDDDE